MGEDLDRRIAALGRHVHYTDVAYWIVAIFVVAIGVGLALLTGLWGLAGLTMGAFAFCAGVVRRRYERRPDS